MAPRIYWKFIKCWNYWMQYQHKVCTSCQHIVLRGIFFFLFLQLSLVCEFSTVFFLFMIAPFIIYYFHCIFFFVFFDFSFHLTNSLNFARISFQNVNKTKQTHLTTNKQTLYQTNDSSRQATTYHISVLWTFKLSK